MNFVPFAQQEEFLLDPSRERGAFAGKRGGKTEVGAVDAIVHTEEKRGFVDNGRDPYIGLIVAPTHDMLMRLSLMKFQAFAQGFEYEFKTSPFPQITWHNGALVYGISADKPQRMEGIKANWVWFDEVFQMKKQVYLEGKARVADTRGRIWATGSLGVQYNNPKAHWVYKIFKQSPNARTRCHEWATADNPHFPSEEIEELRETLDAQTFRQMFELSWDVQGSNLVYEDFSQANIMRGYTYDPERQTFIAIDWGWTHPAAVLFLQYDPRTDTVYQFDEIVKSKMSREQLYDTIMKKSEFYQKLTNGRFRVSEWIADIAGKQEREQAAHSNIDWFRQPPRGIHITYRTSGVAHGISVVRSYVRNAVGQARYFIDEVACPKTVDEFRNYSYKLKNKELTEDVVGIGEDALSALRYFFVKKLDYTKPKDSFEELNRTKLTGMRI